MIYFKNFINYIITWFELMLSVAYHDQMKSNRQLQKSLQYLSHVQIPNHQLYFGLILNSLDVNIFTSMMNSFIIFSIFLPQTYSQMSDLCGLKRQTKYLIKKLLDTYFLTFPFSTPEELQFASINFFRLAVKYNEDPSQHKHISIEGCMKKVSKAYLREDFIQFEIQCSRKQQYSMGFTTPYDYLGLYAKTFQLNGKQIKKILTFLDFSLAITQLIFSSAQEIFFGALLIFANQSPVGTEWTLRQTFSREKSQDVARIIHYYYQQQIQAAQAAQLQ